MPIWEPILHTQSCIKKLERPILTGDDIPYPCTLVFNAGVAKVNGKYVMVFRDDYVAADAENPLKFSGTAVGIAISDNGIDGWKVKPKPLIDYQWYKQKCTNMLGKVEKIKDIVRLYDPRITVLEGEMYLCLAMDTLHGLRGCIAKLSADFESYEIISASVPDNRNMVLFPEKIGGYYVRLERPFSLYGRKNKGFEMWMSKSPDLKFWGESELVLASDAVPFANDKIGPAAPPLKTPYGWLAVFHAVDIDPNREQNGPWSTKWNKRYTAGIMLLDLNNPAKIIGMCKDPLLVPELDYESEVGYRQNVIFPGGMILEDDGEVKIYYGAADTVECVATAKLDDLIALCLEGKE